MIESIVVITDVEKCDNCNMIYTSTIEVVTDDSPHVHLGNYRRGNVRIIVFARDNIANVISPDSIEAVVKEEYEYQNVYGYWGVNNE